jgi:hypothetical protein
MSETATFRTRTTKGFPRWSMTRYAAARPFRRDFRKRDGRRRSRTATTGLATSSFIQANLASSESWTGSWPRSVLRLRTSGSAA